MSVLKVFKEISSLPGQLDPNAVYLVRVGNGFELYVTDMTGGAAYKINTPVVQYLSVKSSNSGNRNNDGAKGTESIAIGGGSEAGSSYSVAIGTSTNTASSKRRAIAIGYSAKTYEDEAVALGAFTSAEGQFSVAIGTSTKVTRYNSTALGYNSTVTGSDQVQLGNSDTTTYTYGAVQDRSDRRDKAEIQDTDLGLDFINALRPVKYKWDYREDYAKELFPQIDREDYFQEDLYNQELAAIPTLNPQDFESDLLYREAVAELPVVTKEDFYDESGYNLAVEQRELAYQNFFKQPTKDGSKVRERFHYGLIADELKETMDAFGIDFGGYQHHAEKGGLDVKSIGYSELISPLIKAVQELSSEVAALKAQINKGEE